MRRLISVFLSFVLLMSTFSFAFAENHETDSMPVGQESSTSDADTEEPAEHSDDANETIAEDVTVEQTEEVVSEEPEPTDEVISEEPAMDPNDEVVTDDETLPESTEEQTDLQPSPENADAFLFVEITPLAINHDVELAWEPSGDSDKVYLSVIAPDGTSLLADLELPGDARTYTIEAALLQQVGLYTVTLRSETLGQSSTTFSLIDDIPADGGVALEPALLAAADFIDLPITHVNATPLTLCWNSYCTGALYNVILVDPFGVKHSFGYDTSALTYTISYSSLISLGTYEIWLSCYSNSVTVEGPHHTFEVTGSTINLLSYPTRLHERESDLNAFVTLEPVDRAEYYTLSVSSSGMAPKNETYPKDEVTSDGVVTLPMEAYQFPLYGEYTVTVTPLLEWSPGISLGSKSFNITIVKAPMTLTLSVGETYNVYRQMQNNLSPIRIG